MSSPEQKKELLAARSDLLRTELARTIGELEPAISLVETGFAFARTASSVGTGLASLRNIWSAKKWSALPGLIWQNVAGRWF